jgi:hypothetical protein
MSDISKTSTPWAQIATMWGEFFTSPSRISKEEQSQYRKWFEREKQGKALVLGVTPEIRSELLPLKYQVTCVDINLDMILAMNQLMPKLSQTEILIRSDWLSVPLEKLAFDIAVGDAVLPNLPWDLRVKQLAKVHELLAPGGAFITRAFCAPSEKRFNSVDEVLSAISKRSDQSTVQQSLELVLELQYLTYNSGDHCGSFRKAKDIADRHRAKQPEIMNNPAVELLYSFWFEKFIDKVFLYATKDEEEEQYRQFFKIEKKFEARDHHYGALTPMYLLRK